jgi:hypothetical protein
VFTCLAILFLVLKRFLLEQATFCKIGFMAGSSVAIFFIAPLFEADMHRFFFAGR